MCKLSGVVLLLIASIAVCNFARVQGIYVPPHVPMQEVGPVAEFEVPWWLGGFVATVNESSEWVLPLTYVNGGKTNTGTTLVIQNRGPFNITLYASDPETIQDLVSYLIIADSTVQFLSATDWVVVSSAFGDEGTDGIFGYMQAENASIQCWSAVGDTVNITSLQCGDLRGERLVILDGIAPSSPSVAFPGRIGAAFIGVTLTQVGSVQYGMEFVTSVNPVAPAQAAIGLRSIMTNIDSQFDGSSTSANQMDILWEAPRSTVTASALSTTFRSTSGFYSPGTVTNGRAYSGSVVHAGNGSITSIIVFGTATVSLTNPSTVTNLIQHEAIATNLAILGINAGFRCSGIQQGGATNYCLHINSNIAASGAGICGGTTGDTCLWRSAANLWTFNAGTSLSVPNYLNVGSSVASSNTNNGAISTTISNPTLQAFGAVTANAASGLLAFTVNTAAAACATAVVTNTNVVAASFVQLTIQTYTGTQFTNGRPSVSRLNTAGSSVGSFTLQLCNDHATNALSGNLFVAFWVLN